MELANLGQHERNFSCVANPSMTLQVTGKNLDIGQALRSYVTDKVAEVLAKFVSGQHSGHIRIEKERGSFLTDCSIKLQSGLFLQSHGKSHDAYASADAALQRLEKRLRRYTRRLKQHHSHDAQARSNLSATDYTIIADPDEVESDADDTHVPITIAETKTVIPEFSVSDAVMQLDLSDQPFLVFRNAGHGAINIVYRRPDGNTGWIDPDLSNDPPGKS